MWIAPDAQLKLMGQMKAQETAHYSVLGSSLCISVDQELRTSASRSSLPAGEDLDTSTGRASRVLCLWVSQLASPSGFCTALVRPWGVSTAQGQVYDVPNAELGRKWFESHILIY